MTAQQWFELAVIVVVLGIFAYRVFALHPDPIRGWIVVRRKSPSEQRDEALALAMDRRFRQGMEHAAKLCESRGDNRSALLIRTHRVYGIKTLSVEERKQIDEAVPAEENIFAGHALQNEYLKGASDSSGLPGWNTCFRAGMEWAARKCEEMHGPPGQHPSLRFAAKMIRMQKVNYPQYFDPSDWAELTRDE